MNNNDKVERLKVAIQLLDYDRIERLFAKYYNDLSYAEIKEVVNFSMYISNLERDTSTYEILQEYREEKAHYGL